MITITNITGTRHTVESQAALEGSFFQRSRIVGLNRYSVIDSIIKRSAIDRIMNHSVVKKLLGDNRELNNTENLRQCSVQAVTTVPFRQENASNNSSTMMEKEISKNIRALSVESLETTESTPLLKKALSREKSPSVDLIETISNQSTVLEEQSDSLSYFTELFNEQTPSASHENISRPSVYSEEEDSLAYLSVLFNEQEPINSNEGVARHRINSDATLKVGENIFDLTRSDSLETTASSQNVLAAQSYQLFDVDEVSSDSEDSDDWYYSAEPFKEKSFSEEALTYFGLQNDNSQDVVDWFKGKEDKIISQDTSYNPLNGIKHWFGFGTKKDPVDDWYMQ